MNLQYNSLACTPEFYLHLLSGTVIQLMYVNTCLCLSFGQSKPPSSTNQLAQILTLISTKIV